MHTRLAAVLACLLSLSPTLPARAQDDAQAGQQATLAAPQLEQLLAPVALYPDPLLTDVLAASANPAQVVEAQRFASENAGLPQAALIDAAASHDWDPSVKALLAFPPVLQMMDSRLEWTEHLGQVFTAQQADVLSAIQRLRQQAQLAGTLQNGPDESVVDEGGTVLIGPPSPQEIYLPVDTGCAYGPAEGCTGAQIGWSDGIILPFGFPQWGVIDWHRRQIRVDRHGFAGHAFSPGFRLSAPGPVGQSEVWRHPAMRILGSGRALVPEQFNHGPVAGAALSRQAAAFPSVRMASMPLRGPVARPMPGTAVPRAAGAPRPAGVIGRH